MRKLYYFNLCYYSFVFLRVKFTKIRALDFAVSVLSYRPRLYLLSPRSIAKHYDKVASIESGYPVHYTRAKKILGFCDDIHKTIYLRSNPKGSLISGSQNTELWATFLHELAHFYESGHDYKFRRKVKEIVMKFVKENSK